MDHGGDPDHEPGQGPDGGAVEPLVGLPLGGRTYSGRHRVRLGDVDPSGRARLDAIVRYLQDVANDDAFDSGIANPGGWVVRRTVVEVHRPAVFREDLELSTFCSGIGACWAERRTRIVGAKGALVEAATLWVQIDAGSGRPNRLGPDFALVYGPSAAGRRIRAKLTLAEPSAGGAGGGEHLGSSFALRQSDLDLLGHVNNAVYWAMVETAMADHCHMASPGRFELEHHRPLELADRVSVQRVQDRLWIRGGDWLAAALRWVPLGQSFNR